MILANGAGSLHMLQRKQKKRYELPTNSLNKGPIILLCELTVSLFSNLSNKGKENEYHSFVKKGKTMCCVFCNNIDEGQIRNKQRMFNP